MGQTLTCIPSAVKRDAMEVDSGEINDVLVSSHAVLEPPLKLRTHL